MLSGQGDLLEFSPSSYKPAVPVHPAGPVMKHNCLAGKALGQIYFRCFSGVALMACPSD